MTAFLVTYDLRQRAKDYAPLYEAIKRGRTWWHYLDSCWILVTDETANDIWKAVASHIDRSDILLIIEVRDNAQGWLPKAAWEWIHEHIP